MVGPMHLLSQRLLGYPNGASFTPQVARRDEELGRVAALLLHMDKNQRLSAAVLKLRLGPDRQVLEALGYERSHPPIGGWLLLTKRALVLWKRAL